MSTPASPWDINYFDPPKPGTSVPKPPGPPKPPKLVPGSSELFKVQRNALKTLQALQDLEHKLGKDHKVGVEITRALHEAENTYRVIRTYLKEQNL